MIRYALKCDAGHNFSSWFKGAEAYDRLAAAGQIRCVICGSSKIEKAIMAPSLRTAPSRTAPSAPHEAGQAAKETGEPAEKPASALQAPSSPLEKALGALREHIEKNSDYVGSNFAREARRIHEGEADARSIWGEASPHEVKILRKDGVSVAPLPWMVKRNS